MNIEKQLIKEYLDLKKVYNRKITYINTLIGKKEQSYKTSFKYEHTKMQLSQLRSQIKAKADELKKIL